MWFFFFLQESSVVFKTLRFCWERVVKTNLIPVLVTVAKRDGLVCTLCCDLPSLVFRPVRTHKGKAENAHQIGPRFALSSMCYAWLFKHEQPLAIRCQHLSPLYPLKCTLWGHTTPLFTWKRTETDVRLSSNGIILTYLDYSEVNCMTAWVNSPEFKLLQLCVVWAHFIPPYTFDIVLLYHLCSSTLYSNRNFHIAKVTENPNTDVLNSWFEFFQSEKPALLDTHLQCFHLNYFCNGSRDVLSAMILKGFCLVMSVYELRPTELKTFPFLWILDREN